jgi:stage V sporulation protein SpoVS
MLQQAVTASPRLDFIQLPEEFQELQSPSGGVVAAPAWQHSMRQLLPPDVLHGLQGDSTPSPAPSTDARHDASSSHGSGAQPTAPAAEARGEEHSSPAATRDVRPHAAAQRRPRKQQEGQQLQQLQPQQQRRPRQRELQMAAPAKLDILRSAAQLRRWLLQPATQVFIPAASGRDVGNALKMLANARSLLLSSSSRTSLAFVPELPVEAGGATEEKQQLPASARPRQPPPQRLQRASPGRRKLFDAPAASEQPAVAAAVALAGGAASGVRAFAVNEQCLQRWDAAPLLARRQGGAAQLAGALLARVLQQGYASVHALGPDAVRNALRAVGAVNRWLAPLGWGVAVIPAFTAVAPRREAAAMDAGVAALLARLHPERLQEEAEPAAVDAAGQDVDYMQGMALHVVRCELRRPWQLLPRPVPLDQHPRAQQLLQQQQQQQQQHQQQPELAAEATVTPLPAGGASSSSSGRQRQSARQRRQQPVAAADAQPSAAPVQ